MNGRLARKAKHAGNPMQQMLLPEPFDEGERHDRLVRLSQWASIAHPGRQFSYREIQNLTGIHPTTIRRIEEDAFKKISPQLEEIKHEYEYTNGQSANES